MNEQWYHEDTLLLILYKVNSLETTTLEEFFGQTHPQYANNVISNRYNSTSHFHKGLISYDQNSGTVKITDKGRREVERRYRRSR